LSTPESWRSSINSGSEEDRRAAVLSLKGRTEPSCLDMLDQALGDESWRVRKAAIDVISRFPDRQAAVNALVGALGDEDNAGRRNAAVESLVAMGEQAVPYLIENISHPDDDVRKFIVDIMGELKAEQSLDPLISLLDDPQENIRLAAIEAMGAIGGERAQKVLLDLLSSEDVSHQFSALHSLAAIGRPLPLEAIKPLLDKRILKRAVYEALGQTRAPESIDILAQGLLDRAKSPKQAAVRAMNKLAQAGLEREVEQKVRERLEDQDLEPFEEFLKGNMYLKKATVNILAMVGTSEAVRILARAANDDSLQADVEGAMAKIRARSPRLVERVVKEEKRNLKQETVEALEEPPPGARKVLGPMSDKQFETIRDLVANESGLYYDQELKYLVERRVQRRMDSLDLPDYDSYIYMLGLESERGAEERKSLINALSTNETYFMREEFQLQAFREEILADVAERKKKEGRKKISIWTAGCSSGEETYTVAILVKEAGLKGFEVDILGTDINNEMIDKAKAAVYTRSSFRSAPKSFIQKHFTEQGARYRLKEDIKKMVRFETANLLDVDGRGSEMFDVIFCRNVIIYFSADAKTRVVGHFYDALNPGGYLLLGHSESLMSISTEFELVHLKHDLVYRKPEEMA